MGDVVFEGVGPALQVRDVARDMKRGDLPLALFRQLVAAREAVQEEAAL